jgi:hypothetical protein
MGAYGRCDIIGFRLNNGETVCGECSEVGEEDAIEREDQLVTIKFLEDGGILFCERCGSKIHKPDRGSSEISKRRTYAKKTFEC